MTSPSNGTVLRNSMAASVVMCQLSSSQQTSDKTLMSYTEYLPLSVRPTVHPRRIMHARQQCSGSIPLNNLNKKCNYCVAVSIRAAAKKRACKQKRRADVCMSSPSSPADTEDSTGAHDEDVQCSSSRLTAQPITTDTHMAGPTELLRCIHRMQIMRSLDMFYNSTRCPA